MRNPLRIGRCLFLLSRIWYDYPDLRLGQLILNASGEDDYGVLYYLEDDKLFEKLEQIYPKKEHLK